MEPVQKDIVKPDSNKKAYTSARSFSLLIDTLNRNNFRLLVTIQ